MTTRVFNSYYRRSPLMTGNECNVTCRTRITPTMTNLGGELGYSATFPNFTLCDIVLPQFTQITFWRCRHRCVERLYEPDTPIPLVVHYDVINMVGDTSLINTGWFPTPDPGSFPINIQRVSDVIQICEAPANLQTPTVSAMGEKGSTTPLVLGQSAYFRVSCESGLSSPCGADGWYTVIETSVEMGFR